ncbi:hypothetical protein KC354_g25 [Hortaea werneckii]|nr:hypothetical protein KC354_g25 [Hortaea werneckii]
MSSDSNDNKNAYPSPRYLPKQIGPYITSHIRSSSRLRTYVPPPQVHLRPQTPYGTPTPSPSPPARRKCPQVRIRAAFAFCRYRPLYRTMEWMVNAGRPMDARPWKRARCAITVTQWSMGATFPSRSPSATFACAAEPPILASPCSPGFAGVEGRSYTPTRRHMRRELGTDGRWDGNSRRRPTSYPAYRTLESVDSPPLPWVTSDHHFSSLSSVSCRSWGSFFRGSGVLKSGRFSVWERSGSMVESWLGSWLELELLLSAAMLDPLSLYLSILVYYFVILIGVCSVLVPTYFQVHATHRQPPTSHLGAPASKRHSHQPHSEERAVWQSPSSAKSPPRSSARDLPERPKQTALNRQRNPYPRKHPLPVTNPVNTKMVVYYQIAGQKVGSHMHETTPHPARQHTLRIASSARENPLSIGVLSTLFGGIWAMSGGSKKSAGPNNTPPLNASSKDEENFIQEWDEEEKEEKEARGGGKKGMFEMARFLRTGRRR